MRYIADTRYRSICVSCGIALKHGKSLPHAKQGACCGRASDQLQSLTHVTLQTHHTEVSVSEVSTH